MYGSFKIAVKLYSRDTYDRIINHYWNIRANWQLLFCKLNSARDVLISYSPQSQIRIHFIMQFCRNSITWTHNGDVQAASLSSDVFYLQNYWKGIQYNLVWQGLHQTLSGEFNPESNQSYLTSLYKKLKLKLINFPKDGVSYKIL
jgi:hypothetical protein